ncbi:MAG: coniferyl aldehyde dehydrogenase [Dokdonella sp.]
MDTPPPSLDSLRAQFDRLRGAQLQNTPDYRQRRDQLEKLAQTISRYREDIVQAISTDFGRRSRVETLAADIMTTLGEIRHTRKHLRRWMRPQRRSVNLTFKPARGEVRFQPLGVIGIVAPWNYPFQLAVLPLANAIAAGNRVMIKPSEFTPRLSELLVRMLAEVFAAEHVVVVQGDAAVGAAFTRLPFDHLLFTGSTSVGREVMRAAAANLTPVTLELGGKSPAIIGSGARFENAVERILVGKTLNAGQTCIAPDYVLLPRERVDAFVDSARSTLARLYPQLASNTQYASIVSDTHYARLSALRDGAVSSGATAHALTDASANPATRSFPPLLLSGVDDSMRVMQEEIFGPLLPLVPYDTLDDALAYVAAHPHPLALYIFEDDRDTVDNILARSRAGGVSVNDTILHVAQHDLPFGGVGPSGIGAYHGEDGFRAFSHMKPVFRQARWNSTSLMNPPYGATFQRLLKLLLGR